MEANFQQLKKEFEAELKNNKEYLNEFDLLRGLQGHNNDIDYVRNHLRAHLRFLSSLKYYKVERHPVLAKYYPWGFLGETGSGKDTFLYVETGGRADPDGLLNLAPISTILLNRLVDTEKMLRELREYEDKTGRQAKVVFIFDMEEFTLDSSWLSVLGRQFKVGSKFFSDRYSETLHKLFVVNCPSYVYYVWKMMQPILPERTKQNVEILYGDEWKEKLLQYVSPDRLPVHWGGKLTDEDGDPMCRSKVIVPPGKIPKELYWRPSPEDPTPEQCSQLAVSAGQFEYVDVKVTESDLKDNNGCVTLKWFFTSGADFSFGVFYRAIDDPSTSDDHMTMDMVFPFFDHLPGPTQVPESAQLECKKPGMYRLRFGNEMGWWSKLNIAYQVKLC